MSCTCNWHTREIYFDQACAQVDADADADADACLHLPMGFRISIKDRFIMNLIKNLCGLKQGGYNFYEKSKAELIKRGCVQSEADPCAFYKKNVIVLCYADDCLLIAQDKHLITELLTSLQEDFTCTDEGEVDGCLDVEIRKIDDGKIALRQPQLIERTIHMLKLIDANPKSTLVVKPLVNKNADGKGRNEDSFHCR